MATIILNANTAVSWVSAISTIGSPTAAELNGGTRLETMLASDGLSIGFTNNSSDISNLGTIYGWKTPSTVDISIKLKFHHDTVADTAWGLFPRGTSGFLAVRRGIARATTFATGQGGGGANGTLAVWKLICGSPDEVDPPNNWDFELDFFMIADPAERAVVA